MPKNILILYIKCILILQQTHKITPKVIETTRSMKSLASPMILLNVASIMRKADIKREQYYTGIITKLIDDIKCFYKPEYNALLESVTIDNKYLSETSSGRIVNPGHFIEGGH